MKELGFFPLGMWYLGHWDWELQKWERLENGNRIKYWLGDGIYTPSLDSLSNFF